MKFIAYIISQFNTQRLDIVWHVCKSGRLNEQARQMSRKGICRLVNINSPLPENSRTSFGEFLSDVVGDLQQHASRSSAR